MHRLIFVMLICLIVPLQVQAATLWDQAPFVTGNYYIDQEFPDFATFSTYQAHDVVVGAAGWTIQSITEYFGDGQFTWPTGSAPVRLNIFSKSGSLPGASDNPTAGTQYTANFSNDGTTTTVTLGGLSINLTAGDYWIGMTPILSFIDYGQEYHILTAPVLGDYSAIRNPGGGFGWGTDWGTYFMIGFDPADAAILIEGNEGTSAVPEPATMLLLGSGLIGLAGYGRKRFFKR